MIDLNALGQALDTTWGRSSTPQTASYSVKFSLHGNLLTASYRVIVNFVSEKEMILMKRSCSEDADAAVAAHIRLVKSTYKDLSGETLKLKEQGATDSLEIINFNVHNPKRTAYYKKNVQFELV